MIKQYEYKLSKSIGLITLILFGLMAWSGFSTASTNEESLTVLRVIELSPNMATYFWWGSATLFLMLAILGLVMTVKSFQAPRMITLTENDFTAPQKPISTKLLTVKYSDISKLDIHNIINARQLRLNTAYGKIVIPDVNFTNKAEFDEMVALLRQKTRR